MMSQHIVISPEAELSNEWLSLPLSPAPQPATCPPEMRGLARDEVKLLVLEKRTGQTHHQRFRELPQWFDPGDVLVVNTSQTLPASLPATIVANGLPIRLHLAARITKRLYIVERRDHTGAADDGAFQVGERLQVDTSRLTVIGRFHPNSRLWYVETTSDLFKLVTRIGAPIRYGYLTCEPDITAFQTIFARHPGSAEMPSAARPFTPTVVRSLQERGVQLATITLHTGVSSHEVKGALDNHPFLPEWYQVSASTAAAVNTALRNGRKVIAVGTTVVRALESAVNRQGILQAQTGWTTLVITPERQLRALTGIVTGLHESGASHLAMMYAFVGREKLQKAYQEAVAKDYLWHEFGDSHLIF